jgi:hypothetical protein
VSVDATITHTHKPSYTMETTDAMTVLDRFSPEMQEKIKDWYPKIEAAQRVARSDLAQMMLVLNEHPIALTDEAFATWEDRRKQIVANYEKSWKEYQALIKGCNEATAAPASAPAPAPASSAKCQCSKCSPRAPRHEAIHSAKQSLRRSPRLATKPRINYEEEELEEEREAREARVAERKAKAAERKAKVAEGENKKATEKQAVEAELEEVTKEMISMPSSYTTANSYMQALLRRARLQGRLAELEGGEKKAVEQFISLPSLPSLPPLPSLPGF